MHTADQLRLGLIGLTETHALGIVECTTHDRWGMRWSLHIAGPEKLPQRQGTGFLVRQELEVIEFHAVGPRVSWIRVRLRNASC